MAAAALYLANFDFGHPWSLSVEEQFYVLWPGVLKKWRHRVAILVGVVAFAPLYRVACHFLRLHGRADETFPAVADVLAIGCLLAIFAARRPKIKAAWALAMVVPVGLASASYHLIEQPMLRVRERKARERKVEAVFAAAGDSMSAKRGVVGETLLATSTVRRSLRWGRRAPGIVRRGTGST
jgi:peptidoglycan/LPS O-acetylase OafA/YrhL